jgi:hypothetical protein
MPCACPPNSDADSACPVESDPPVSPSSNPETENEPISQDQSSTSRAQRKGPAKTQSKPLTPITDRSEIEAKLLALEQLVTEFERIKF